MKKGPDTRAPNALARLGFVSRPMIGTDEVTLVFREKLVVHPVER